MRVVSNTSPISGLAIIGRLDVLRRQFGVVGIRDILLAADIPGIQAGGGGCPEAWRER